VGLRVATTGFFPIYSNLLEPIMRACETATGGFVRHGVGKGGYPRSHGASIGPTMGAQTTKENCRVDRRLSLTLHHEPWGGTIGGEHGCQL